MIQVEGPKVDREDREDGWAEAGGGSGVRRAGGGGDAGTETHSKP